MVDRRIFVVMGVVAAVLAADMILNGSMVSLFLVKKLFQLVDYLEFWR